MKNQKPTPNVVATVWHHWKIAFSRSKSALAICIICYSLSLYLDVMYRPVQWKNVFDRLVQKESPWEAFALIVIASIVGWVIGRIGETYIVFSESKIIKDLKDYCMNGLLGKSTQFFTNHPSSALVTKAKRFAHVSETVIDEFIFSIMRSVLLILYILVYSWIAIPELTGAFVLWIIVFMALTIYLSRLRMKYDLQSSSADSATTGHIGDILLSVFTLRMFSAIPRVRKTFEQVTKDDQAKRRTAWFFGNLQWAIQGIFVVALELYCMSTIIEKVVVGTHTLGTAVLVQSYIASLTLYMWGFGKSLIKVRTAFADAFEMAELLNEDSTEPIHEVPEKVVPKDNSIKFSGVTFGYSGGSQAVKDFSFNFMAGRRYGLVGETGSGKSTLTKLILQAHAPNQGSIEVCNEPIEDINKLMLRSWISYVPQDPQFPSWSVRDIITMGNPEASNEMIISAAKKASCDFIWNKLTHGLDTMIGERGIRLSGGERQRLAIAAAILKDAPIVIMDEPTSALDAKTEHSIQQAIQEHFENKTLIVIAHRLSTVAVLDEIIFLENGTVKDFGPHDSLLETSSEYREMWDLQTNPHMH